MSDPAATNPDMHILEQLAGIFRRRWTSVMLCVAGGLLVGLAYAESQPPLYASSATVLVRSGFAANPVRPGIQTSTPEEEGQFLSQLELIKSESLADAVAGRLALENDPAFIRPPASALQTLQARIGHLVGAGNGGAKAEVQSISRDAVAARLQAGVKALRAGRTYVAAISFTHTDPSVAQKVAQAYAETYKQALADADAAASAKVRQTVEAEIGRATGDAKAALEQKYQDTVIERALPGVDALIISDARKPGAPISPRKPFLVAVGLILGAALGCLLAGWRELRDRGIRDGDIAASRLGLRFLGYQPRISMDTKRSGNPGTGGFELPSGARLPVSEPFSRFSEIIRAAAVSDLPVGAGVTGRVIGVTSVLPGEGKTVFAANLASHVGNQGCKVLLIDGDFRHPELSNWLAPDAQTGVIDAVVQDKPLGEASLFDARGNVTFLPAAVNGRGVEPAAFFAGERLHAFLDARRKDHDVIIIDLPSLTTASDARAVAPLVDRFILLAEWGGAPQALIETVLAGEKEVAARISGLVMAKTDLAKLPLYVGASSRGAYQKRIGGNETGR